MLLNKINNFKAQTKKEIVFIQRKNEKEAIAMKRKCKETNTKSLVERLLLNKSIFSMFEYKTWQHLNYGQGLRDVG